MDNEYPTEEQLKIIREWPLFGQEYADPDKFTALMAYIRPLWYAAEMGYWQEHDGVYEISTAGWSGNESIIEALEANEAFWMLYFCRMDRGGHYVFASQETWIGR